MPKSLSHFLSALESITTRVEDKLAKARQESGELLEERIEESKAELQRKQDEFIIHAEAVNAKTEKGWDSFKNFVNQKLEHIKAEAEENKRTIDKEIDENKFELNVESAEQQYNNSVDYAACCIEWASVALSEVEKAMLESFAAKQKLDAVKN